MKNSILLLMAILVSACFGCKDSGEQVQPVQPGKPKIVSPIANGTLKSNFDEDSIMVYLLTQQQYEELLVSADPETYVYLDLEETTTFWPVKNCYGEWIITQEELNMCDVPELSWVFNLPTKGYCWPEME
jgi:hypothetical protein